MYYKISNNTDVECLANSIDNLNGMIYKSEYNMLKKALDKVKENMDILSNSYGENRDVDKSLGGFVLFFTSTTEDEILQIIYDRYGIAEDCFEYDETIARNSKVAWKCTCFLVSSDYGITIIRPVSISEDRSYVLKKWKGVKR